MAFARKLKLHMFATVALSAGAAVAVALAPDPAVAAQAAQTAEWAQEASDLEADPEVRFGTLSNGMRYAIRRNATPPGEASLRLHIDAGSLNEAEDQRGLAHFLEHMVLNGTRNVPEGEFIRRLERAGLKFGPDTNASTGFDQTIYMLDLPETDAETIDTALFLLREVADEATLDPAAIDAERGIILSEERTRATPGFRILVDEFGYMFQDDLLPQRLPIGSTDVVGKAQRDRFLAFYHGYYRPERATLVAVGDFDVDQMEAKIRSSFEGWRGEGPAAADPAPPVIADRGTESRVFIEPGGPTRVSLAWVGAADNRPDTAALRTERAIEQLGLQILNRRFERLATGANPPFIGAQAARSQQANRIETVQLLAVSQAAGWQPALAAIEQEHRRALEHGFTQAELDREINEIRAALTAAAAGAETRRSSVLAQQLVAAANDDDVFTTPAADLALFEESVRGLTAERVTEAYRGLFEGQGPLVYMTSPTPVEGGEKALLAAYQGSRAVAVAAPQAQQAKTWDYTSFGTPGTVAERSEMEDIGVTNIRFANNVRLTVKPTKFADDEILVAVRVGDGQLDLPRDRANPLWAAQAGFTAGGLGKLTLEELQEVLAGRVYGAGFGVSDDAFVMSGKTRPEDFALQMQLLAAYLTDAGWRPTGWDRMKALSDTIHNTLASTPGGVFQRDAGALLHSGDPRWATPTREEMAASGIGDARKVLEPVFGNEPIEVTIVGDVTVEEAIAQTAATFGALPQRRESVTPPDAKKVAFPAADLVRRTHSGRADQGLAYIAWPTDDFYSDQKRTRTLNLLGQVLQLRLTDEIREKQGTTYSPNAGHSASQTFPDYGQLSAQIEAPPERLEGFITDALKIAADLRDKPVTEDELNRARRPLVENIQRQRTTNQWWLTQLGDVQVEPNVATSIREGLAQYEAITAADVQAAAREYLSDAKAWKMLVTPQPGAQATAGTN